MIGATQSAGAAYVIYGMSGTRTDIDISSSLSAADGYKITGTGTGFGYSNAGEGDFNGDGMNDFATASFQYSSNKGQTALFFGDVGTFSVASMTASEGFRIGPTSAYFSARSIALSGDVNGDGYDDLFIGAPRTNYSASTAGSAYLVFGRADVPSSTDLATYNGGTTGIRIDGTTANEKFANAVALADINGDGCSDMIMGSAWGSIAKTYVIFGGLGQ